jgi:hypothetical protein
MVLLNERMLLCERNGISQLEKENGIVASFENNTIGSQHEKNSTSVHL